MLNTPKSLRLHIGIFGKRNAGKSTLINTLTHQETSIVSEIAGTTTDTVEKAMEMLPLGPVVFIDTAGIDDEGNLGEQRVRRTMRALEKSDVAIIVSDFECWDDGLEKIAQTLKDKGIPIIALINKCEKEKPEPEKVAKIEAFTPFILKTSLHKDENVVIKIKDLLIKSVPEEFVKPPMMTEKLLKHGQTAILVTPQDKAAPKGRLIMPEAAVLRELLDRHCIALVATDDELKDALGSLKNPPAVVITDSQAFKKVAEIVPQNIPLTSFSIIYANVKGDLTRFCEGARKIAELRDGDKILICESCTHHQTDDDIAKVKIPALIRKTTGKDLIFEHVSSCDFPEFISRYALIIHCGGCMTNRREILSRIEKSSAAGVPITNYGLAIARCLGIFDRAVKPFANNG